MSATLAAAPGRGKERQPSPLCKLPPSRGGPNLCTDMAKKEKETYAEAITRLEKIVAQIDNSELDIDQLADRIREANEIIAFCAAKLTKAEGEVEKLLADGVESKE